MLAASVEKFLETNLKSDVFEILNARKSTALDRFLGVVASGFRLHRTDHTTVPKIIKCQAILYCLVWQSKCIAQHSWRQTFLDLLKRVRQISMEHLFDGAPIPDEVFAGFSRRAKAMLRRKHVSGLFRFLAVTKIDMLGWCGCGVRTAEELTAAQEACRALVIRGPNLGCDHLQAHESASASCNCAGHREKLADLHIDHEAPFPSICRWLDACCRSKKSIRAFVLRQGILGEPPKMLTEIGQMFGLASQPASRMNRMLERWSAWEQPDFRPLIERAAGIVRASGGSGQESELAIRLLTCGPQVEMLRMPFVLSDCCPCRSRG